MDRRVVRQLIAISAAISIFVSAACERSGPARPYPLRGQVLSVQADKQQITIKHEDVEGFMPAMTMTFPVASPELMKGREPGELIYATLEVTDAVGRLTKIERTGFSELPADSNAAAIPGNLLEEGDLLPDAAFIDQTDRRRTMSEWRGSVTLLTFIYTRCPLPNYCPLMDRHFAAIQAAVTADAALRDKLRLVTLSFDPEFDTPAVLAAHAKKLRADPAIWTMLTGDRGTMDKFAAKLGVGLIRPSGAQEITHNLRTALVGADGRIEKIYTGNEWTPSRALEDIRAAVKQP
ncbi:MAG TPA: SCO family protein [Vicinamibacterales bacterium]|nr:SCO family protein [Vicinamibacterales bacterium]